MRRFLKPLTAASVAVALIVAGRPGPAVRAQEEVGMVALLDQLAVDPALRARVAEARLAPPPSDIVAGRVVVKFRDAETALLADLATEFGVQRMARARHGDFHVLTIDPSADPAVVAAALSSEPGVIYAEPDWRVRPLYRPNDPLLEYQWNFAQLDFERAWEINRGSSGVIVAVVDGGVAYTTTGAGYVQAPDLAQTTFLPGYNFIWENEIPIDFDGHGTHVTGTIAQSTDNALGTAGVAFNARIIPIKALSGEVDEVLGAPNVGTTALVADAIRFAVDKGAKVVNLSLGGPGPSTALRDAIEYAVEKDAVVVIAVGNSGDAGSPPSYPAVYARDMDGVIAVGATTFGRARAPYSNVNDYVEIAAPGGDVEEDLNDDGYGDGILQQTIDFEAVLIGGRFDKFGYFFFQGTSMATPHVAGMAALLIDQGVTEPAAVEAALKRFATDLGPSGRDDEFGYGLINPRATLRGLGLAR